MKLSLKDVQADPIYKALDPASGHFMEARYLPEELGSAASHGIRVAALIPTRFPHIKTIPTVQMMLEDFKSGLYDDKHTIVVDSSGNTAHAVARLARAFGFSRVTAVMSADVPSSKKEILAALSSVKIIEAGGGESVAEVAREEGKKSGHYHLNQYAHRGNMHAHELYTGPEILRVLGDVAVIAIAMGSGGTAAGVGSFFQLKRPKTTVLGVRPMLGQQVPGARDSKRMAEVVRLPWEDVVHHVVDISRKEAFIRMRQLWSAVEPQCGPTSGLAWGGIEQYLDSLNSDRRKALHGKCVAFICPDDGRFYSERTTGELDTDQGLIQES